MRTLPFAISVVALLAALAVPYELAAQTKSRSARAAGRPAKTRIAKTPASPQATSTSKPQAPKVVRIVALEELIRAGIDQDALDAVYINGSGLGCTDCRFSESQRDAYDASWNTFLSDLMNAMLRYDVGFSELILRAYFAKDGTLDYLLYHVGGGEENNRRFLKAAEQVYSSFTFEPAATGPFKQSATISLGAPVQAE